MFYFTSTPALLLEEKGDHLELEQADFDNGRTFELEELGVNVVRFSNQDVQENLIAVLEKIKNNLASNHSK